MRRDGRTYTDMTKLLVVFRNFATAPLKKAEKSYKKNGRVCASPKCYYGDKIIEKEMVWNM